MNRIRRLLLTSGTLLMLTAGICFVTAPADAAVTPAAPLQEEMQFLTPLQQTEDERLMAVLWVQRSAEYRGLSYQAYNLATMEVDKALAQRREEEKTLRKATANRNRERQRNGTKFRDDGRIPPENETGKLSEQKSSLRPLAVVLDIDETIVSNAPLGVYYLEHPEARANYNAWEQWIVQHNDLLPGAGDFLKYADKHGIQVFYVTGRGPQDKEATSRFLQKAGLPFPDATHLLMNDRSGSKMNHFARLARRYDIICYLGDNAGDFPIGAVREDNPVIYKEENTDKNSGSATMIHNNGTKHRAVAKTETRIQNGKPKTEMPLDIASMLKHDKNAKRNRIIDEHKRSFGTKFILLPNPMYGDWESNLAKKYRKLPAEQRIALRKAALKRFEIKEKRK